MLVFDTNILVSFALFPQSDLGGIIKIALVQNEIAFSRATFEEIESVLLRTKFDKYVSRRSRTEFMGQLAA